MIDILDNYPTWKLEDAKAHFSDLVRRAQKGPQRVTVRGKNAVVILSCDEFTKLLPASQQPDLFELMQSSPWQDIDIELAPSVKSPVRDIEL